MSKEKPHDLYEFMRQLSDEMAAEYDRIQKRATEDPGTAGDQGEENWAELLRGWLPRTYEVVTKGRIINQDGETSPQVDVLVLKSVYPEKLLNKKLYLAAGVAAAFECKTTLKASHIQDAVQTCAEIKSLYPVREGTPYKELHAPIIYGLLAHSHSWKGNNSTPTDNIAHKLVTSDNLHVKHPRETLDFLCVADLATWTSFKFTCIPPEFTRKLESSGYRPNKDDVALSSYYERTPFPSNQVERFTPIGVLIASLTDRLAWEDPTLRDLAHYYQMVHISGGGEGLQSHLWPISIYSEKIRSRVESGDLLNCGADEWSWWFF